MTFYNHQTGAHVAVAVLLLLTATVTSCTGEDAAELGVTNGFAHQCKSNSDCAEAMMCHDGYAICVGIAQNSSVVGVTLVPPANQGLAPAHLNDVTLSTGNELNISLPPTISVSGRIRVDGNFLEPSVPSVIVVVAKDPEIKGLSLRTQTSATAEGYELLLLTGVTYTLTINVEDTERPTYRQDVIFHTNTTDYDIWLPDIDTYPLVEGRVYQDAGAGKQPLKGAVVTAILENGSAQCTTAITDKLGAYSLRCPISTDYYLVRVGPSENGPIIPNFQATWPNKEKLVIDGDRKLSDIVLKNMTEAIEVTVRVVDPGGSGLPGVPVALSSQWPDSDYWKNPIIRQDGVTDVNGNAVVNLVSGTWRVTAFPHATSPWAITTRQEVQAFAGSSLIVTVGPKVVLSGSVTTGAGKGVEAARVVARSTMIDPISQIATSMEYATLSNENGEFELPVDPGEHEVTVTPTDTSALPRWLSDEPLAIGADGASLSVNLPIPTLVEGIIQTPMGQPAAFVAIDVYSHLEKGAARLIGGGQTDESGTYRLIIPCPK